MCGIFGSKDKRKYIKLYLKNKERGDYSYGGTYISDTCSIVHRSKTGPFSYNDIADADYYIGHTRAPTGSQEIFDIDQCHPFSNKKFVYAHNGILTTTELEKKYGLKHNVDSKWLSTVFEDAFNLTNLKVNIIGTYAVWGVDQSSKDIYLFRGANPIYWDSYTMSFSSQKYSDNFTLLDEGKVYMFNPLDINKHKLEIVGEFNYNSPYFIPGE